MNKVSTFVYSYQQGSSNKSYHGIDISQQQKLKYFDFYGHGRYKFNSASSHIVHRNDCWLGSYLYATAAYTSGHSVTFIFYEMQLYCTSDCHL